MKKLLTRLANAYIRAMGIHVQSATVNGVQTDYYVFRGKTREITRS